MSQELRDLMVRTAESAPTVRVGESLWRDAHRARRRRLVLTPVVAALVLLAVLGSVWQGASVLREDAVGPVAGENAPALPSRIYALPEHLDGWSGDGWIHEADSTLAVGTASVAFSAELGTPMVVSAVDGSYHLLDLPGYDPDAVMVTPHVLALSPDGRRLAYSWRRSLEDTRPHYVRSGIRVLDLTTGEVTSHEVRAGYGVWSSGFSWSPRGRYLAYNLEVLTSTSGTSGPGNSFIERLDTTTGRRLKAAGLPFTGSDPAVTDEGTVLMGYGTALKSWNPHRGTRTMDLTRSSRWQGNVTGIGSLPGSDRVVVSAGSEPSRLYVGRPDSPSTFRQISAGGTQLSPAGPVGDDRQVVLEQSATGMVLWTIRTRGPAFDDRADAMVTIEDDTSSHYSFASELLRSPPRDFPAPDWPLSEGQIVLRAGLVLLGVVVAGGLGLVLRARRRRTWPGL